jgi:lipopolysaccharide export system ATP-binding protein
MPVLHVEQLEKRYGDRKVVDGVSLRVESQQVIGLLGPNGAGKTTTF